MLAGLLCACILVMALVAVRARETAPATQAAWSGASRREIWLGFAAVVATGFPLVLVAPWFSGPPAFWGDDATHARVAAEVATFGLPHGWIESYLGGFPFAIHYPPTGWLLIAALIKLGFSPAGASHMLGTAAVFAIPLAAYVAAVRCGARPMAAVVGATCVAWIAPYNPFVGGYETFFAVGLLSQILATPICLLLASTIAKARSPWPSVLLAAVAMVTHPQLGVATLVIACAASLIAARAAPLLRCTRACVSAIAIGGALYGPGLMTLKLPFGWPPGIGWRLVGFPPARLVWWFRDGDLLDVGRAAVITQLAEASLLALMLLARRPAARAIAGAGLLAIVLSVSGRALATAGPFGLTALSFLQPLRMVALLPLIAGAMVTVALEEGTPILSAIIPRLSRRWASMPSLIVCGLPMAILLLALPNRLQYVGLRHARLANRDAQPCGERTPAGYDSVVVHGWLRNLSGGRLWYSHTDSQFWFCGILDGLELSSAVPLGNAGGAGSHVGVLWVAFKALEPSREGSAKRAEALGVRYVLGLHDGAPPPGWRRLEQNSHVQLWTHDRPTNLVGVGCVRETWRGTDAALRDRVQQQLTTPEGADKLLSPDDLVVLERADTAFEVRVEPSDDCDPTSAAVVPSPREPGALEAVVTSQTAVDVVLRVSAFPTWKVEVDGQPAAPPRVVAPGFLALRIPAGEHRLVAVADWMPGYFWGLLLGSLMALAAAFGRRDHVVRGARWIRERHRRPTGDTNHGKIS